MRAGFYHEPCQTVYLFPLSCGERIHGRQSGVELLILGCNFPGCPQPQALPACLIHALFP